VQQRERQTGHAEERAENDNKLAGESDWPLGTCEWTLEKDTAPTARCCLLPHKGEAPRSAKIAGIYLRPTVPLRSGATRSAAITTERRTLGIRPTEIRMRIVINGVGIAGPTLAYWLRKACHDVLLVESAPQLRSGGYVIDFGLVGYDVAEKMGIIPRIRELVYQVKEMRFVDRHGRKRGGTSTDVINRLLHGRYTSLRRSDLAATIFAALDESVETIFGDSVARIEEEAGCVRVSFDRAPAREADLVIGADGLHSRVRQLAFGPDAGVEVSLGYHVAAFEVDGYRPRDELVYLGYGVPGRQIFRFSMRDDRTLFLFVFRDE
jgi:2-polyprenyl-6-methoxyphenol hydroxylase-like FAD-dependent oxidoreductase